MTATSHDAIRFEAHRFPLESLPAEARRHADAHRWWESERYGFDQGSGAYIDWYHRHWKAFCRWRYFEHLTGQRRFREFGDDSFGSFSSMVSQDERSLEFAVHKYLRDEWENLQVFWFVPGGYCRDSLVTILDKLDINGLRDVPVPEFIQGVTPQFV